MNLYKSPHIWTSISYLMNCFISHRKKTFTAIAAVSAFLLATPVLAAVNHVISNPGPEVFTALQQVGYFNTSVLNTNPTNGLHRGNRVPSISDGYAFLSANANICGGSDVTNGTTGPMGMLIVDVHNPANPFLVNNIPDAPGTFSTNVAATQLKSGMHIVVRAISNSCAPQNPPLPVGVAESFQIYNVDNPSSPVLLSSTQVPELNNAIRTANAGSDPSMNHLAMDRMTIFQQGQKTYLAMGLGADTPIPGLGLDQIWDISNPNTPVRVSYWGPEMVQVKASSLPIALADLPGLINPNLQILTDYLIGINPLIPGNSFTGGNLGIAAEGIVFSHNGNRAYAAMSEGGLALLDISNISNPKLISVALDLSADSFNLSKSVSSSFADATKNGKTVVEVNNDETPYFLSANINGGPSLKPVAEGGFTHSIISLPGSAISGNTVYVGTACGPVIAPPNPSVTIGVALRGSCTFTVKVTNVKAAGYAGFVLINSAAFGNATVGMAGTPSPATDIPGWAFNFAMGSSIFGGSVPPPIGTLGFPVSASVVRTGWGYVRIWDFSDEQHPKLASTFQTLCSSDASLPTTSCPVIGSTGGQWAPIIVKVVGNKAYIGWSSEGLVVIDIKDPYNPKEIARFGNDQSTGSVNRMALPLVVDNDNGNDWDPIYAIDVNAGLYILELNNKGDRQTHSHGNADNNNGKDKGENS